MIPGILLQRRRPAPPPPLSGITTVWIYDASIGVGITAGFEAIMSAYAAEAHGLTLTFVNKSVSGENLAQIAARYEAEKAAVAGRSDILIVTMPLGNSIDGSWATRSESYRAGLISQFAAFIDSITANGNIAMPVNTTFRNYDQTTVNAEENGSLPYNREVLWPYLQTLTPQMWYDGAPFLDPYNVARNWYSVALAGTDPIHYTAQGSHQLRTLFLDVIVARIKGLRAPRVRRVPDPTVSQLPPLSPAMLTFAGGSTLSKSTTVYWAMQRGQSFIGTGRLLPLDGYEPNRLQINVGIASPASNNNGGAFNTGNTSRTLLHDAVKNSMIQTSMGAQRVVCIFQNLNPGQAVRLELLSCRAAAGATDRWAQFSVNLGTTWVDVNGAYAPGDTPSITTIMGTANSSGALTLLWRMRAGSAFAYLNGVMIYPM